VAKEIAMDPTNSITLIVTALVAGATAALKDTASTVVKDAYAGLKALIVHKYTPAADSVQHLEGAPDSKNRQGGVAEDLGKTDAGRDPEVLQQAQAVIAAVEIHDPEVGRNLGVDLAGVRAAALRLSDIHVTGSTVTGVKVHQSEFSGDIEIKGIRAGGPPDPKA